MVERDGQQPVRRCGGRRFRRPPAAQALLGTVAAALLLLGGATSAFATSGEDENSIQLSGAAFCPEADLDALHVCFDRDGDDAGSCELFDVSATGDVLSSVLCPLRSVLSNPEVVPDIGPVDTGPIVGMSTGYLRALMLSGATEPTYAVTQSFPDKAHTVEVAELVTSGLPACTGPRPAIGTDSDAFCSALANALPRLGVSTGEIVLAIGYEYDGLDPIFNTDFMTVWACGERQAQCIEGSPESIAGAAGGAVVLDEIWLRNWLTNSGLRIWR